MKKTEDGNLISKVAIVGTASFLLFFSQVAFPGAAFADQLMRSPVGNMFYLIEGSFGALIMVSFFVFGVIATAMGHEKTALGFFVLAVVTFILRQLVSLFFGVDYQL